MHGRLGEGRPDSEVGRLVGHWLSGWCVAGVPAAFYLFHLEEIRVFKAALRRIEYCSMG